MLEIELNGKKYLNEVSAEQVPSLPTPVLIRVP
jgi:hypothetical protein